MSHLILVRHGQSEWNLQKKFTGWVDVELAPNGKLEACKSGEVIKKVNFNLDYFLTTKHLDYFCYFTFIYYILILNFKYIL